MIICLDAGHGGNDTGAVGPTGLEEASVVLEICEHAALGLEALGLTVLFTREEDVFVELGTRCDIANSAHADYFVSCHCNSNGPSAVGVETLYKTDKGKALATPIQAAVLEMTGDVDRGLKHRTDLYVLNGTQMPACLAEVGFVSNPDTEQDLATDSYKRIIAHGIVVGISQFLGLEPARKK